MSRQDGTQAGAGAAAVTDEISTVGEKPPE